MGNKHIEETLTDYFGELLNEPNEATLTAAPSKNEVVDDPMDVESSSAQAKPLEVKHAPIKLAETKPIKSRAIEATPVQEAPAQNNVSQTSNKNLVFEEKKSKKINVIEDDLKEESRQVSKPAVGPLGSYKKPFVSNQELTPSAEKPSSSVEQSVVPLSKASVSQSSDAVGTAAYQQHKQRLERMLQQVSALDSSSNTIAPTVTPPTVAPPTTESRISTETEVSEQEQVDVSLDVAAYEMPPLSSEWLGNGRPNWAQEQFDILLIEVNGLQLAVPLVALGQIQDLDEEAMTSLFGQSDWFMGLQKTPMGNVKTVNTAKFVMPERYKDEHNYKYVVSINGLSWGLAVDNIHQPISIDPDSIRWRPKRDSRPWMAGMVKDHMCVLLDIPAMGEILQEQDKNHAQTTGG